MPIFRKNRKAGKNKGENRGKNEAIWKISYEIQLKISKKQCDVNRNADKVN